MTMAMDADVRLLIGVARGGADGDSEALIRKELAEIMKNIKATVTVDTRTFGEQLRKELDAISNSGKFYVNLSKIKIGAGAITDFRKQLSAVINTINLDKGTSVTLTAENIGEVKSKLKDAGDAADEAARKVAAFKVQMEALGHQKTVVQRSLNGLVDSGVSESESQRVASLVEQYRLWAMSVETVRASKEATSDEYRLSLEAEGAAILENINRIYAERQAAEEAAAAEAAAARSAEAANKEKMATINEVISAYKKVSTYIDKNPRIDGTELEQLKLMREQLLGVWNDSKNAADGMTSMSKTDLRKLLSDFAALDTSITESGKKGNTLVGIISSAYKKFGGWMLVTRSLMVMVNNFKQMVTNVRALDAAMTELKKVTDETRATYTRFFNEAAVRAKSLGATLTDTITATADFARLGYSISEAAELADAALVYKNVGDGINDISEASESVISTMKAFGIEAANVMTIVDRFNEVGNRFAISSKGVGDALVRSASALAAAGNSLDESIALVTAANNVVQDPEKVGTTMKTVSMYLRAAKTEAEEAGESTEGMAESVSKLRKEILALTSGRVDIQLDENTFKSTYQILKELSKVWGDLTDITKANIMEMIGGKRNSNVVASLLNNFADAEAVLEVAMNSAGSALNENEKYLDSINGKVAQFQAAFEKLSASFVNSGLVKGVVDGGTAILETLTAIIDKLGSFPALISTITAAVTAYSGAKGKNLGIFDVVDGKVGLSGGITDWSAASKNIAEYNKVLGSSIQTQQIFIKYLDGTDDALSGYLKSLKGGKASMSGYKAYCKQAGIETKAFGASSKAAAIGVTALNTAINMLISLGIGLVIQGIITGITHLINASDEAIEKANELTNAFNEFRQTNSDNIDKLQSLKEEFETLSHGVSRYGENISLTADEYDRYKQIVQTIVDISPALSEGYKEEMAAEKDLMELKKSTIASNVGALRALGFEVEYNSETNELYIKNLEHLNELTASSAGKYDTLQEATNALRKETEGLIDVTEKLNDDNIDAASSIEDLGYQVQETKNNIIDYIEEVYKKQIDAYQKIINLRKEMIESAKDEFDYEADIADKVKEIADLQARIDQLALDDSRSAQAERNTLMQELEEKQKDLADTQRDHSVEAQTNALDKMGEDYESDKEAELELLRSTVNSSEELWTAFYQTLLGQSVSVGASIDAEISSAWIRAAEAVRQYSDAVSGVSGVGTVVSNVPKYHDGGVVDEANLSKDEALAILQKGEVVLNEAKQKSLYRIIDFQAELSKRLGVVIGALPTISAPSSGIRDTMSGLTQDIIGSAAQSLVFEPHFEVNITHSGEMADTDAKAYGERIADVAIDKLYSAFERRGINSTRGSRLKP